jgi:ADP-ribose diphosphatase
MQHKPAINKVETVAQTRIFSIEEIDLTFTNGEKRIYERLTPRNHHAIMIIPFVDEDHVLLIKEYSMGIGDYTLSFPKGLVENSESLLNGAQRELKEEIGMGAESFEYMRDLKLSPNYMSHGISIYEAKGLYEASLIGDEPEPLEVVSWPLRQIDELMQRDDFIEARSVTAALLIWKKWLQAD